MATDNSKRLMSLDALRGLDMFFLVMFWQMMRPLDKVVDSPFTNWVCDFITHRPWDGLSLKDIYMPIFLFCSGTAIPFAFRKYREQGRTKSQVYLRMLRRFALLWIFGMIKQGELLSLDPEQFNYFNNTLQLIAIGYTVSALLFMYTKPRTQLIVAFSLLAGYWAFLTFGTLDGIRSQFTPELDMCVRLGRRWEQAIPFKVLGEWLVCWPGAIVTFMTGMFAGEWLQGQNSHQKRFIGLLGFGAAMLAAGYLLSLQMPVIKHTWNTSFTLVTSGYGFVVLGIFYYLVDYKGWKKCCTWLMPLGMNAIFAYMIGVVVDFKHIAGALMHGVGRFVSPEMYAFIIGVVGMAIFYLLLCHLYKRKIFIKI